VQYHEVRVYVELEEMSKLICWSGATAPSFSNFTFKDAGVMVDYIYLDSEERRRFAQVGHEYLIEQVQFQGEESLNSTGNSSSTPQKFKLNFNHPCKEIVWALKCGAFNGEALKSTFSGSRGRFLAYTNDDAGWDAAVDYAAKNLAYGMFSVDEPDAGTLVHDDFTYQSEVADGESASFEYEISVSGEVVTVTVNVDNSSGDALASAAQVPLYMVTDPLVKNSYNLGKDINAVTVNLTVTGETTGTITSIVVTDHDLNIREVSVPVEDWTDSRVTTVSGKNKWDTVVVQPNNYGLRLDGTGNPVAQGNLQLNGHERFQTQLGAYFNYVQPSHHHTHTPADGVNAYSFGLNPEQHQPQGTANLSRIDNTFLVLTFSDSQRSGRSVKLDFVTDSKFYVFALSYNVLRIDYCSKKSATYLVAIIPNKKNSKNMAIIYYWLVDLNRRQSQIAGNSLEFQNTTSFEKSLEGSRLIVEPDGNNFWKLDNPQPSFERRRLRDWMRLGVSLSETHKVQSRIYRNVYEQRYVWNYAVAPVPKSQLPLQLPLTL